MYSLCEMSSRERAMTIAEGLDVNGILTADDCPLENYAQYLMSGIEDDEEPYTFEDFVEYQAYLVDKTSEEVEE